MFNRVFFAVGLVASTTLGAFTDPAVLDACPGYTAARVKQTPATLTADLVLAGPCNVFGPDIKQLSLSVVYETETRIHLKITDASSESPRFEVPESVLPRPLSRNVPASRADIHFNYTASPFSFTITRTKTSEVLFSTVSHPLIFEPQYLRLKTAVPENANIYGLGEHTNTFRLDPTNTTRTMWSRDAYGTAPGTNLYGNHPVYLEHRTTGTHGVFLLNANGMDIKLREGSLEYNVIGGIIDLYVFTSSSPEGVVRQYAEIVGKPAEVPYWGFGFHQCRFGYVDFVHVAEVIDRYAAAGIPLETMWTDIDYMDRRRTFSLDPVYFPLRRMREIVSHLHDNGQKYIVMTDPAIAHTPGEDYPPFARGSDPNIWLKLPDGSDYLGLVWPGVTVYPDWFNPNTQHYWTGEFSRFYDPNTGLDVDGMWIDMNEPASFCNFPCQDPAAQALEQNLPPPRTTPPPNPNAPIFVNSTKVGKRQTPVAEELLFSPPYEIENAAGGIANKTAYPNVVHSNGLIEYDAHNLFGTMMSKATQQAMLARRPSKRTLIITRSTFAGAGASVGKWMGDNFSLWEHYRFSIAAMLGMASIYQVPFVGSDICGFAQNTTESLCARWATLGAFYPFMRNHNEITAISQEFYLWESVTEAAKNALDIRYRLLDYIYTALHQASVDGSPILHPLWFKYPQDEATFGLDLQFFYGDSILVSPVTEEGATSVSIYLPKDIFYDFKTLAPVQGAGTSVILNDVPSTDIPLHIRGGAVLPLRVASAMTTNELREQDFELVVAPGLDGNASGNLYIDDGESLVQSETTEATFEYSEGKLVVGGEFMFKSTKVARVRFLGVSTIPKSVQVNGKRVDNTAYNYNTTTKVLDVSVEQSLGKLDVVFN